MQFERAEYAAPGGGRTCAACQQAITAEYFEARGQVLCPRCAGQLRGEGGRNSWLRAAGYGAGAALLGTIGWYAIIKIFNMQLGIIAVAVGLFVGKAVRKGSGGRGGWKYQALAMGLTYMSITASYVPDVIHGIAQHRSPAGQAEKAAQAPARPMSAPVAVVVFLAVVLALAFAAPLLGGVSAMGLVIIAIALYEAWKITRPVPISGPFRTAAGAPPGP
jgi:hypothetical protein